MAFIAQFGGDVKAGKTRELQEWLAANEKEYANSMPEGARYLGTYFAIFHSDKEAGACHTFLELESYGTQDALADEGRGDGTYGKLTNELFEFFEQGAPNWTSALYKRVVDATLFGE